MDAPTANQPKPGVWYSDAGDSMFCYLEGVPHHMVYINPQITVYKAEDDNRIIGVRIDGIKKIIDGK